MDIAPDAKKSEAAARNMVQLMNEMQMKSVLGMFNSMSERCFRLCMKNVDDDAPITTKEDSCIKNCTEKWQRYSQRVQLIFAEENTRANTKADLMQDRPSSNLEGGQD
jgi:import inner membrane translocase subunit TIM9